MIRDRFVAPDTSGAICVSAVEDSVVASATYICAQSGVQSTWVANRFGADAARDDVVVWHG